MLALTLLCLSCDVVFFFFLLYSWVEKTGYIEATVAKLQQVLKKMKLRRVICQISGSEGIFIYWWQVLLIVSVKHVVVILSLTRYVLTLLIHIRTKIAYQWEIQSQ